MKKLVAVEVPDFIRGMGRVSCIILFIVSELGSSVKSPGYFLSVFSPGDQVSLILMSQNYKRYKIKYVSIYEW